MKLLKTIALALAGSGLLVGPALAQKKWDTVRIATEGAYAPWNFTVAGGKLDGFEIELANDLCARMKVKCEIVAQDFEGSIPALQAGKYDVIMAGMSITDERKKVIDFTRAYANAPNGFLVEKRSEQHELELAAGRIDAVLADSTALLATAEKPEFKDYALVGPGFVGGLLGGGVGAGIRKQDAELKKMFDDAIAAATADGTVKRLSEKWFKIDAAPQS